MTGNFPSIQAAVNAAEELVELFGYTLPDGGIGIVQKGVNHVPLWGENGEEWMTLEIIPTHPGNYKVFLWIEQ